MTSIDTTREKQSLSDANNIALARLTQHPNLNKPLATVGLRYFGQMIDGLITVLIYVGLLFITKEVGMSGGLQDSIVIVTASAYFLLSDGLPKGQSLGKKLLNISVISKSTGKGCSVFQSFIRNMLTPFIGAIDAIFILTKQKRRLGDYMANTIVIKNS